MNDGVTRCAGAPVMDDDVTCCAGAPVMDDDVTRCAGECGARDTVSAALTLRVRESQLRDYGIRLAGRLRPGAVVALVGDLGAGKTALTKAIAEGLGVTDTVTSPTFTLINEYGGGRLPLYHFDVYRLGETDGAGGIKETNEPPPFVSSDRERREDVYAAMDQLGWEDYFYGKGVCVVEWADMIEEILPKNAIRVKVSHTDSPDERIVTEEQ
jgi:tRNA threonylcarbamoyladenosine biosynthesis protein TsaE